MHSFSCPTTTGTTNGTPIGGISATTASLFNVKVNDAGFGTTNFDVGFSYGFTQPFASGYANVQTLTTDGDALNIVVGSSNGVASTGNWLIDGTNKRTVFNSLTPSSATHTLNGSISCIGASSWVDGSYQVVASFKSSTGNELQAQCHSTANNTCFWGTKNTADLALMANNSGKMFITQGGRVGINNSSPRCPLEVSGTNSSFTITNIATNSYSYDVSSNSWANRGGGPFTLTNLNAWFNGNIYIQAGIWATSDRRLKENIIDIDLPFERYKALRPVSYNYKNEPDRKKLGLIAQEVLQVCGEAVSMVPNENLASDGDDSPEGVQLGLDYNTIMILNVNIIKKLIARVEELESTVAKLAQK